MWFIESEPTSGNHMNPLESETNGQDHIKPLYSTLRTLGEQNMQINWQIGKQ